MSKTQLEVTRFQFNLISCYFIPLRLYISGRYREQTLNPVQEPYGSQALMRNKARLHTHTHTTAMPLWNCEPSEGKSLTCWLRCWHSPRAGIKTIGTIRHVCCHTILSTEELLFQWEKCGGERSSAVSITASKAMCVAVCGIYSVLNAA